jgi:hypothetical protein
MRKVFNRGKTVDTATGSSRACFEAGIAITQGVLQAGRPSSGWMPAWSSALAAIYIRPDHAITPRDADRHP